MLKSQDQKVGMRRLELPTPTSRTWCASQLRYIPMIVKKVKEPLFFIPEAGPGKGLQIYKLIFELCNV